MNEEHLFEVKRVNSEREKELEETIYEFNKQRDQIYLKAKADCAKDEKRKREKFQSKVERIK